MTLFRKIIYILSTLTFIFGVGDYFFALVSQDYSLFIGLAVLIPLIFSYNMIVSSGRINVLLYILILSSGFLILSKNNFGLPLFLVAQSILLLREGSVFEGLIKSLFSPK